MKHGFSQSYRMLLHLGWAALAVLISSTPLAAELSPSATLDEALALATRREQPAQATGYDIDRFHALERLWTWPDISREDEARIVAAFQQALRSANGNLRNAGAMGLGRRGHGEVIPQIFDLAKKDSNLIGCFFQMYPAHHKVEPPVGLLRRGLRSRDADFRSAVLQAIEACQATALRAEVEKVLAADPLEWVRDKAAFVLARLACPESLPALRRAFHRKSRWPGVAYALTQLGGDADVALVLPCLRSKHEDLRGWVASGLMTAHLVDARPACDALLGAIRDPSDGVRHEVLRALARFRETRAIPAIRDVLVRSTQPVSFDDCGTFAQAIGDIGGPEALTLLDDMLGMGFRDHYVLQRELTRLASPSSGRAMWSAYLRAPIHPVPDYHGPIEDVSRFLIACADADLVPKIRERINVSNDSGEKEVLEYTVQQIEAKMNK